MFSKAWGRCRSNLRANLITGVCIWVIGGAVIFSYYELEYFANLLDHLGSLKTDHGFLYSALSTSLFGGVIPYAALLLRKSIPKSKKKGIGLFFLSFFGESRALRSMHFIGFKDFYLVNPIALK